MKRWQILLNIIFEIAVFLGGALLLIYIVPKLLGFFWPFVASWILALLAVPLCNLLEKHIRLTKKWASAVIIILVLVMLAGAGYFVFTRLGREMISFLSDAPLYYSYFQNVLYDVSEDITRLIEPVLPDVGGQIQNVFHDLLSQMGQMINGVAPQSVKVMSSAAANLTSGLIGVLVMILSAYFFIADRDKLSHMFMKWMPEDMKETALCIRNRLMSALGGFVIAQFKIMVIVCIILLAGFIVMRNPYALLLAVLISFLDLLPIFGTGTVLIPWALISFLLGNIRQAVILVILYVICLLARQLLQPKIIGDSVGMDTLPTLALIYTGYKLRGLKGIIFALFLGVIIITLYRIGLFDKKIKRISQLFYEYRHFSE